MYMNRHHIRFNSDWLCTHIFVPVGQLLPQKAEYLCPDQLHTATYLSIYLSVYIYTYIYTYTCK